MVQVIVMKTEQNLTLAESNSKPYMYDGGQPAAVVVEGDRRTQKRESVMLIRLDSDGCQ